MRLLVLRPTTLLLSVLRLRSRACNQGVVGDTAAKQDVKRQPLSLNPAVLFTRNARDHGLVQLLDPKESVVTVFRAAALGLLPSLAAPPSPVERCRHKKSNWGLAVVCGR